VRTRRPPDGPRRIRLDRIGPEASPPPDGECRSVAATPVSTRLPLIARTSHDSHVDKHFEDSSLGQKQRGGTVNRAHPREHEGRCRHALHEGRGIRHKRASGACRFLANSLVEGVVSARSRSRSQRRADHRQRDQTCAAAIAQIQACAAWLGTTAFLLAPATAALSQRRPNVNSAARRC